jgi:hypothetical protein
MVSESVLIAVVAGVFTILGAAITPSVTYLSDRRSSKEAAERLYHQHALEKKFNTYQDLYLAFDDCISRFREANLQGVSDIETYQKEVDKPYRELRTAWDLASIYIDDEGDVEVVEDALDTLNDSRSYLKSMAEASDEDSYRSEIAWDYEVSDDDLEEIHDNVTAVLKPRIDPIEVAP